MNVNVAQSFNFFPVPTDIHFGCGMLRSLPERIQALGATRPFLVTDPGSPRGRNPRRRDAGAYKCRAQFEVCHRREARFGLCAHR